jgi:hypothetical protein
MADSRKPQPRPQSSGQVARCQAREGELNLEEGLPNKELAANIVTLSIFSRAGVGIDEIIFVITRARG